MFDEQNPEEGLFLIEARRLHSAKLGRNEWQTWVEDAFIDPGGEDLHKSGKSYLGVVLPRRRIFIFFFLIIVALGLLLARAGQLQIVKGDYYAALAERNRIRIQYLAAPRGIIYDSNGAALVKNIPNFSLYIVPFDLPSKEAEREIIKNKLATIIPNWQEKYSQKFDQILKTPVTKKEYFEPQTLIDPLDYNSAMQLQVAAGDLRGIGVKVASRRQYLNANAFSLSHVLGYEGVISADEFDLLQMKGYLLNDRVGKTGLEYFYESDLRGKDGRREVEVDSAGKEKNIIAEDAIVKGNDLILAINANAQKKLEEIVNKELAIIGKQKAVAIALDPRNGKIIAMVSAPTFDNNLFTTAIKPDDYSALINNSNQPLFSRAVSGNYPSGSVIKPVIAAAALQEGIINENTSFLSVGGIKIEEWFFPDWKAGGHGITNVTKALADSVNTFFYIIGGGYQKFVGLGVYKIKEYAELFGLNKKLGIDLPSEGAGFLPTPGWKESAKGERWYIGDTYHLSIGQGDLLVTPLQVAAYTAVFANGGTLYQPQLVVKISNEQTGLVKNIEPKVIRKDFVSQKTIDIVRRGMRQAVTTGSARRLADLPMPAAGKTGTAQWDLSKKPHAWFTGFAPYNHPEVVITILVEEGNEGSTVCAPIARDFLNWWYYYKKGK